jgi:hypothetical protein
VIYTNANCLDEVLFTTSAGLACYNSVELLVLCFRQCMKQRFASFWGIFVAALGIILYGFGDFLSLFQLVGYHNVGTLTLSIIGWCCMVTGQSLVLWSRLHLILDNPKFVRRILCVVIFDAIILHLPMIIAAYGANSPNPHDGFVKAYTIIAQIQLIGFFVQEILLSAIYIWGGIKFLKVADDNRSRRTFHELIIINVIIIAIDGTLVSIQYASRHVIQLSIKALLYSVKLKLEYEILGGLAKAVKAVKASDAAKQHNTDKHPQEDNTEGHSTEEQNAAEQYNITVACTSTEPPSPEDAKSCRHPSNPLLKDVSVASQFAAAETSKCEISTMLINHTK